MISVTLPVPQDKIKAETNRIREQLRQRQEEIQALFSLMEAVRKFCKHKYNHYVCDHCGHDCE